MFLCKKNSYLSETVLRWMGYLWIFHRKLCEETPKTSTHLRKFTKNGNRIYWLPLKKSDFTEPQSGCL